MKRAELISIHMPNRNVTPSARWCTHEARATRYRQTDDGWLVHVALFRASFICLYPLDTRTSRRSSGPPRSLLRNLDTKRIAVLNCHLPFGNCRHRRDSDRSRDDAMRERILASATQTVRVAPAAQLITMSRRTPCYRRVTLQIYMSQSHSYSIFRTNGRQFFGSLDFFLIDAISKNLCDK